MMQKGFSLPEITVAMGLVAGVSLVTMKLVENNAKNQNTLVASAEIQKAVALLKSSLNDPNRCRSILRGQGVQFTTTADGKPIRENPGNTALGAGLFQEIRSGASTSYKELLRPNTAYRGFRTAGISLRKSTADSTANDAELIITFANETDANMRNDGSIAKADKGTRIVIPLIVKLNAANEITDCTPSVSEVNEAAREKFCLSLGNMAVWDSTGSKTCKFRTHQCSYGEVPSIHQANGSLTCVPLSRKMYAHDLFNSSYQCTIGQSRNFKIINDGTGKLRIDCSP